MKKLMYLLPVAALALASCTNNDEPAQAPELAKANSSALQLFPVVNATTRATAANMYSDSNLPGTFYLTTSGAFQTVATPVNDASAAAFNAAVVTKNGNSWDIAGGPYYWPSKSATSDFTAFTKAAGLFTAATNDADQHDLMVAYTAEGSATDYEAGVALNFKHILSQVVFKATNADKDVINVKVAGIRLNNIFSQASFTLPTADAASAWSGQQTAVDYKGIIDDTANNAIELNDVSAQTLSVINPQMLVPQTLTAADLTVGSGAYLSVLIQVTDATTGNAIYPVKQTADANVTAESVYAAQGWAWAAVDLGAITWEAGKKYTYTLNFTKNGIGKVDPDQGDPSDPTPGTDDPTDPSPNDPNDPAEPTPGPGDDIIDSTVPLVLTVTVSDWEEIDGGSYDM